MIKAKAQLIAIEDEVQKQEPKISGWPFAQTYEKRETILKVLKYALDSYESLAKSSGLWNDPREGWKDRTRWFVSEGRAELKYRIKEHLAAANPPPTATAPTVSVPAGKAPTNWHPPMAPEIQYTTDPWAQRTYVTRNVEDKEGGDMKTQMIVGGSILGVGVLLLLLLR